MAGWQKSVLPHPAEDEVRPEERSGKSTERPTIRAPGDVTTRAKEIPTHKEEDTQPWHTPQFPGRHGEEVSPGSG